MPSKAGGRNGSRNNPQALMTSRIVCESLEVKVIRWDKGSHMENIYSLKRGKSNCVLVTKPRGSNGLQCTILIHSFAARASRIKI